MKADEVKPPAASFGKTEKDYTETKEQARKVVFNGAMAAAAALDLTGLSEPAAHADPRESEKMALVCVRWENDRRKRIRESLASLKAKAKGADVEALEESVVSAVDFYFKEASAGNLRKWRSENVK